MVWRALETAVREPVAVYATPSSGGMYTLRVALRQRVPGEARNAIAACFGALTNVKNVFVVDPDIDIFSDEQMDWAFATRFQADRDLMVMEGMRTVPIDPSLMGSRVGAKAGFDLTWPVGAANKLEMQVPAPPTFEGKRFAVARGRARGRAEILRGPDERGRQPRRPRDRPRAGRRCAQRPRSTATPTDAISSRQSRRSPDERSEIQGHHRARPAFRFAHASYGRAT